MDIASRYIGTASALTPARSGQQELVRQLADPNSVFYQNMLQQIQKRAEEQEEQDREDAIIEAFGQVIDAMNRDADDPKRPGMGSSFTELVRSIGELEPDDPERVRLEGLLRRLNELGIWFELPDMGQEDDGEAETLTELLTKMRVQEFQAEI